MLHAEQSDQDDYSNKYDSIWFKKSKKKYDKLNKNKSLFLNKLIDISTNLL